MRDPGPLASATSRRDLLVRAAGAMAGIVASGNAADKQPTTMTDRLKISVFSKHFQWTGWDEAARLAADIGFDGLDLTVRDGGHVLPERVEEDLPKAQQAVRKAGSDILMITTGIVDASSPHASSILKTASELGIRHYRWGGLTYSSDAGIDQQIARMQPRVKQLWELSKEHGMCGMYHTHSGPGLVGAPIWDVWLLCKDLDPRWIGVNYDIGHATVEGGYGGWIDSTRLLRTHMVGIALKDFKWERSGEGSSAERKPDGGAPSKASWSPGWCAAGEGMVNFEKFFSMVKTQQFRGPVQLHFEYPGLGGAENGQKTLTIPKSRLIAGMRRDLTYIKGVMRKFELV